MNPRPPTLDEVCAEALRLPCSPSLLPRLTLALQDDGGTVAELERIISIDSALASATLRAANSALYAGADRVATLGEAVMRLGQREIYRLAALALVGRWETVHRENLRWDPGDYARHSVCTALAAEVLAERSGRVDPARAYTAGLVCDVGKLALAYLCASFYPTVAACCQVAPCTWEQAEKSVLGYHHAEVGGRLLRAWNFPDEFVQAVEHQFAPAQAPAEALPLLAHLHGARYLAVSLGPGVTEEGFLFSFQGPFLSEWGFTGPLLEQALIEVKDRAEARLGSKLTTGSIG